jgi:hypothetical protein
LPAGFFCPWVIARLLALGHEARFDRWVLSEREQAVKLRNRLNAAAQSRRAKCRAPRANDRKLPRKPTSKSEFERRPATADTLAS